MALNFWSSCLHFMMIGVNPMLVTGIKPRVSGMLVKRSTNWSISPAPKPLFTFYLGRHAPWGCLGVRGWLADGGSPSTVQVPWVELGFDGRCLYLLCRLPKLFLIFFSFASLAFLLLSCTRITLNTWLPAFWVSAHSSHPLYRGHVLYIFRLIPQVYT